MASKSSTSRASTSRASTSRASTSRESSNSHNSPSKTYFSDDAAKKIHKYLYYSNYEFSPENYYPEIYMINLLEEQQDQKTGSVTEEVVLYSFLGVFIIFIVDSFTKVGKYTR